MNRSGGGAGTLIANEPRVYTPSAAAARAQWDAENNIVRRFAFLATMCLLFLKLSSIHEFLQAVTGRGLPVMYIFVPPAALGMLASGGLKRTLRARAAWCWVAFTTWLIISLPFSSWVGGSVHVFYMFARTELLMLFLLAGTIVTWNECRWVFTCAAFSALIPIAFSLHYGGASDRLNLDFQGSITNANYLAAHLLLLLAFCLFFILRPKASFVSRIIACGVAALGLYAILRTGSRGAMIALGVGTLLFLLRSPTRQRVIAAFLAPVAIAGALFLIPTSTLNRLMSFSPDEDSRIEAIQSSESRQYLLRKSIEFSLQYPVFGVGMGQFSLVEGKTSREAGERGNWHETHNAYTQVSSETGMPALLFFAASIVAMLMLFNKIAKRAKAVGHAEMMVAANCAFVGAAAFCFAIFFLSLAYIFYLPALTGLAIAMNACADRELSQFAARRSALLAPAALRR